MAAVVAGLAALAAAHSVETVVVVMQGGGLRPSTVRIRQGDTVVFENRDARPRWPASNIHPTHHVYPEFDSRRPILPGERWSLAFERTGTWNFHDHLDPEVTGTVVVEPDSHAPREYWDQRWLRAATAWISATYHATRIGVIKGYYRVLPDRLAQRRETLDVRRVAADDRALRDWLQLLGPEVLMGRLRQGSDGPAPDCHQEAHQIGRASYDVFGAVAFQRGDMACAAGYSHGAMEAFLRHKGTANLAADVRALCGSLGTRFAQSHCYHGVGHGVMANEGYDLPRAIETCRRLDAEFPWRNCLTGVFMENVVVSRGFGMLPGHKTRWVSDDPHFPCNAVGDEYTVRYHCYDNQTSWMLALYRGDFDQVAEQCRRAPADVATVCFTSFGRDVATQTRQDPARILPLCDSARRPGRHYEACLGGALTVITDFWGQGLSDQATALCRASPADGKAACYGALAGRLLSIFPSRDGRLRVCRGFEEAYQPVCARITAPAPVVGQ